MNDRENLLWAKAIGQAEVYVEQDRPEATVSIPAHILISLQKDIANARNLIKQQLQLKQGYIDAKALNLAVILLEDK